MKPVHCRICAFTWLIVVLRFLQSSALEARLRSAGAARRQEEDPGGSTTLAAWASKKCAACAVHIGEENDTLAGSFSTDQADCVAGREESMDVEDGWEQYVEANDAHDPYSTPVMVKLDRVSIPITHRGKVVSFKTSYAGYVHAGYPTTTNMRVVFDTGSGHVILPSSHCDSATCRKKTRFDLTRSESAIAVTTRGSVSGLPNGDVVTIVFGTGRVSGHTMRERVCLGPSYNESTGDAEPGICVVSNNIMAFNLSDNPFASLRFDGIVGLSLQGLAVHESFSLFELLSQSGQLPQAAFGIFLVEDEADGEVSEIAFGGHNPQRLASEIKWADVVSEVGYWAVKMSGFYINDVRFSICDDGRCQAVADSGTSHLGIPYPFNEEIDEYLRQNAHDYLDCRLMPGATVKLEIAGEFNLTLTPDNYYRRLPIRNDVNMGSLTKSDKDGKQKASGGAPMAYVGQWLVNGEVLVDFKAELSTWTLGSLEVMRHSSPIEVTWKDVAVDFVAKDGSMELHGEVQDDGVIHGKVVRTGADAGNFTLTPAAQPKFLSHSGYFYDENGGLNFKVSMDMHTPGDGTVQLLGASYDVDVTMWKDRMSIMSSDDERYLQLDGTFDSSGNIKGEIHRNGTKLGRFYLDAMSFPHKNSSKTNLEEHQAAPNATNPVKECRARTIAMKTPPSMRERLWILGEPILHKYYTLYNWETPRVGFARAQNAKYRRGGLLKPGQNPKGEHPEGMDIYLMQHGLEVADENRFQL